MPMNFVLPPEVTVKKHKLEGHWAYTFQHDTLGKLGRIILQDLPGGQCHVASEVAGDPANLMTKTRLNIL
jgi:hypothetical protein